MAKEEVMAILYGLLLFAGTFALGALLNWYEFGEPFEKRDKEE